MKYLLITTLLLSSLSVSGQTEFEVFTSADGGLHVVTGTLETLVLDAEASTATLDLAAINSDLVMLQRVGGEPVVADAAIVHRLMTRNGESMSGRLLGSNGETLRFQDALYLDVVVVPLDEVVAVTAMDRQVPHGPRPSSDEAILSNGDRVTGFFLEAVEDAVVFESDAGTEVRVPIDALTSLRLADVGSPEIQQSADATPNARVRLVGGVTLLVKSLRVSGDQMSFVRGTTSYTKPASALLAAEPIDAGVTWMADLAPTEATHQPYLSAFSPPHLVGGLTASGQSRSIVVRPRGSVAFEVPAGDVERLVMRVRIENETARLANADVRVLVDGTVAFERLSLAAADGTIDVAADVKPGQTVTLAVDYGQNLDVEDAVVFIRPAFLP